MLHGINSAPNGPSGVHGIIADADGLPPMVLNDPALFRYCFPETIITVRNPRPHISPRMANYAFLYGFRFEMELRYLADQQDIRAGKHTDWHVYAASVTALRQTYADLLLHGRYRADDGFVNGNPKLAAAYYAGETRNAIALWNDTDELQPVRIEGVTVRQWAAPDAQGDGCPQTLVPGGIVLLLL